MMMPLRCSKHPEAGQGRTLIMTIIPQKRCTTCQQEFPATREYFCTHPHGMYGVRSTCKPCQKAYDAAHASVKNERKKALRLSNPAIAERRREQERAYIHNNAEVVSERKKAYYDAHPEQRRTEAHRRRALVREVSGNHTAQDVIDQYKRQRGKCYYCKKKVGKIYHIDHIIPLSRGGSNDPSNLVVTCQTCNSRKHNKLPHEWPAGGRLM